MNLSNAYEQLSKRLKGAVLLPGEPDYRESQSIWNSRLHGQPSLIARCRDTEDVAACVSYFSKEGTAFSVKGGGHSFAGNSLRAGYPMIDLSPMKAIDLDLENRRAWLGAGVKWGEAYAKALAQGMTFTGGTVSGVGVSGYTLGGGTGYLARSHGLAIDNVLSMQVVTGGGEIVTASEEENPDLFWALRGGSGNFGIVTRFLYKLHPMQRNIFAGQVMYLHERAEEALQVYREVMEAAPPEFTCYACAMKIPPLEAFARALHGKSMICFVFAHVGDQATGQKAARNLRSIGSPILDTSGPHAYLDVQRAFDAGCPEGQRWYSKSNYMETLTDDAIRSFVTHTGHIPGEFSIAYMEPLGCAIRETDAQATAFPHREAGYSFNILSGWSDPEDDKTVMNWSDAFQLEMAAHSDMGVYVNLLSENEASRIPQAYGSNLKRLQELKQKWDPQRIFDCTYTLPKQ